MTEAPAGTLFVQLFGDRHGRVHRVAADRVQSVMWKTKCGRYGADPALLAPTIDHDEDLKLCQTCWPCGLELVA